MGYEKNEMIMALLKAKGPILPVDASKKIGDDILISSAYLATMVSRGEVKISNIKVGGSPLYYLPGQEALLQNFSDRLNPPEKRAYNLLKEQRILRDSELEPVLRVSLRQLKDFAMPLNVKHEASVEVFWKWYLLPDTEAEPLIARLLQVNEPVAEKPAAEKQAADRHPAAVERPVPAAQQKAPEPKQEEIRPIPIPVTKKTEEEAIPKPAAKEKRKKTEKIKQEKQETLAAGHAEAPSQRPMPVEADEPDKFKEPETKDKFFEEVKAYFDANSIMVLESAIVKKNSELDMVVSVPSAVGRLTYYCKAKNKKKSNDGDLASAYVQGQSRKLPTLYLSRGELMKKASEMLGREFRGIVVKTF